MPVKCKNNVHERRGGSIQPHGLHSLRFMAMDHRRYMAWFHSTPRVIIATPPERHTSCSLRFRWGVAALYAIGQVIKRLAEEEAQEDEDGDQEGVAVFCVAAAGPEAVEEEFAQEEAQDGAQGV